jgi:cyclic lactone autoinducer peptide
MKKIKFSILAAAAALFTLVASLVASSACIWGWYQPEEPKSLQK